MAIDAVEIVRCPAEFRAEALALVLCELAPSLRRVVDGGSGFASQNDRRLHFGLGAHEWVDKVVIHWPSGSQQVLSRPAIDRLVTITEPER